MKSLECLDLAIAKSINSINILMSNEQLMYAYIYIYIYTHMLIYQSICMILFLCEVVLTDKKQSFLKVWAKEEVVKDFWKSFQMKCL